MSIPVPYSIRKQQFWLSPERLIYWENEKALIVSDLHFGKTGHFRKSGIAIPQAVYQEDLQRMVAQIQFFQPSQLIIVGDMFHSVANKELDLFQRWRADFPSVSFHLVKGNHDILHDDWYQQSGIEVYNDRKELNAITFVHDVHAPNNQASNAGSPETGYCFSGHIHPGIRVSGAGKQSLCFPCFYFGKKYAVLPAFSHFTGLALLAPNKDENVFAIVQNKIVQLQ